MPTGDSSVNIFIVALGRAPRKFAIDCFAFLLAGRRHLACTTMYKTVKGFPINIRCSSLT